MVFGSQVVNYNIMNGELIVCVDSILKIITYVPSLLHKTSAMCYLAHNLNNGCLLLAHLV